MSPIRSWFEAKEEKEEEDDGDDPVFAFSGVEGSVTMMTVDLRECPLALEIFFINSPRQ
jgi:hypothetical protein